MAQQGKLGQLGSHTRISIVRSRKFENQEKGERVWEARGFKWMEIDSAGDCSYS